MGRLTQTRVCLVAPPHHTDDNPPTITCPIPSCPSSCPTPISVSCPAPCPISCPSPCGLSCFPSPPCSCPTPCFPSSSSSGSCCSRCPGHCPAGRLNCCLHHQMSSSSSSCCGLPHVDCSTCCRLWRAGASRCAKLLLATTNLLFLVCGATLVMLGFWLYIDTDSYIYMELLHNLPAIGPLVVVNRLPALFLIVGVIISVIGFLGCCGACYDSVCFLALYSLLLFIVLTLQLVAGIATIAFQDQILYRVEDAMQHQLIHDYNKTAKLSNETSPETNHVTAAWDIVQIKLGCCGAVGPKDYMKSTWYNLTRSVENVFVPPSCCVLLNDDSSDPWVMDEDGCQIGAILYETRPVYRRSIKIQGCQKTFVRWLRSRVLIVIMTAATAAMLQILLLVFACVLLSNVRRRHSENLWFDDECG